MNSLPKLRGLITRSAASCIWAFGLVTCAPADVLSEWNRAIREIAPSEPESAALFQARVFAMTHRAMYEAIAQTPAGRSPAERGYASVAAASSAACHLLVRLLPHERQRFESLHATQVTALGAGRATMDSLRRGRVSADRIWQAREHDQWPEVGAFPAPSLPTLSPVPPPAQESSPWPQVVPFILKSVREVQPPSPHHLDARGRMVPDERLRRARIFDRIEPTVGPDELRQRWRRRVGETWNMAADEIAARAGLDLVARARLFAALNAALADATIASAHWRFVFGSWRSGSAHGAAVEQESWPGDDPARDAEMTLEENMVVAAKRLERGALDPRPAVVLLAPLRDFPALEATLAGAAEVVFQSALGSDRHAFSLGASEGANPGSVTPSYARISAAARECAFAASMEGRHTREACVAGYELGREIGKLAWSRVRASGPGATGNR